MSIHRRNFLISASTISLVAGLNTLESSAQTLSPPAPFDKGLYKWSSTIVSNSKVLRYFTTANRNALTARPKDEHYLKNEDLLDPHFAAKDLNELVLLIRTPDSVEATLQSSNTKVKMKGGSDLNLGLRQDSARNMPVGYGLLLEQGEFQLSATSGTTSEYVAGKYSCAYSTTGTLNISIEKKYSEISSTLSIDYKKLDPDMAGQYISYVPMSGDYFDVFYSMSGTSMIYELVQNPRGYKLASTLLVGKQIAILRKDQQLNFS